MIIVQNLVSPSRYWLKCPYEMTAEFIVTHNTANDASAENEISYMINNDSDTSFHYAVDDKQIVQGIPENRNSWNAGDGADGEGNRKGLSVEICYSASGGERFIAAEKNAAKFIASKLKERGWGVDRVKKHQDFSGKYCPHRTLDMGWQRFLNMIQAELDALNAADQTEGVLYRVQIGAYRVRENAEKQLAKAKAAGFTDAFITTSTAADPAPAPKPEPKPEPVKEIKVGSTVMVKQGATDYNGNGLASFVYARPHEVVQLDGNRAVIAYEGTVVAAVHKDNLILVA